MTGLQIDQTHLEIVLEILKKYSVLDIRVFGSRAKNKAKPLSDLDLCILNDVDKTLVRKLRDDFEESNLPFKVDIVRWSEISEEFKKHIEKDLMKIG